MKPPNAKKAATVMTVAPENCRSRKNRRSSSGSRVRDSTRRKANASTTSAAKMARIRGDVQPYRAAPISA